MFPQEDVAVSLEKARQALLSALAEPARAAGGAGGARAWERIYFSGDWDVHWGYGLLTHEHMSMVPCIKASLHSLSISTAHESSIKIAFTSIGGCLGSPFKGHHKSSTGF